MDIPVVHVFWKTVYSVNRYMNDSNVICFVALSGFMLTVAAGILTKLQNT